MNNLGPALVLCGALAACATEQTIHPTESPTRPLDPQASAYVAVPADGRYGETVYDGSGRMTAQVVTAAFAPHLEAVRTADHEQDHTEAISAARRAGVDYLIMPRILHWEDRATEWSGIRDRVEVMVTVLDTSDGRKLSSATIEGTSSHWTFGGDHPQDLLPEPTRNYVSGLF